MGLGPSGPILTSGGVIDLHKRLKKAKGEEKKNLERQIARTDRQIDDLVYELYGLTEKEMRLVEESK